MKTVSAWLKRAAVASALCLVLVCVLLAAPLSVLAAPTGIYYDDLVINHVGETKRIPNFFCVYICSDSIRDIEVGFGLRPGTIYICDKLGNQVAVNVTEMSYHVLNNIIIAPYEQLVGLDLTGDLTAPNRFFAYVPAGLLYTYDGNTLRDYPALKSAGYDTYAPAIASPDNYYDRHYSFWNPVHQQLSLLPDNGTFTVNTEGYGLDHIQHFVFDALVGTNRTLVVQHQGETYVISGNNLGGIALGHNHLFYGNLDAYRQ